MMDLKTMREKIAGNIPLIDGETKEMLIEQWKEKHKELEALSEKDERNYIGFDEVVK